jgi:hypothetical protein
VLAGGEVVVDGEPAFTADREVSTEGMPLISELEDQGPAGRRLSERAASLPGHGGDGGLPRLPFVFGEVFPQQDRGGKGGPVGFVSNLREAINEGGHTSIMPEVSG